jgi:hypothetical protein
MIKEDYVTISQDSDGFFVQELWFNKRTGEHTVYDQGTNRYANFIDALMEALEWAEAEELDYIAGEYK